MSRVQDDALILEKLSFIKKIVGRKGYKLTEQRKLILREFIIADKHLTAEDIYHRLKNKNIGLATIYRSVKMFNEIGILKEIIVDGVSYYELKIYSRRPLHLHFQCLKCNELIDIDEREVSLDYLRLNRLLEEKNHIEIYDLDIVFTGLCKKCSGRKAL